MGNRSVAENSAKGSLNATLQEVLWIHDQEMLRQCEEDNLHHIDDNIIAVAEKFGVEPRKLLSHVLEYTLKWN